MSQDLVTALKHLAQVLPEVRLPLEAPEVVEHRRACAALADQLTDYVLPRLGQLDAPLLAVVGGSTGAGKSTLVNSVVGRRVTAPGVLRPTTRSPVLVANPADLRWFEGGRILPGLARTTGSSSDPRSLELVGALTVPPGLAVLDAPDIDSVEVANRTLATQLLAAADLWLFVTSAARYADQVPWDFLRTAAQRSTALAVVLDRVPPGATEEIATHLREMLDERGLATALLFTVEEGPTDTEGLLEASAVAPIRRWLDALAADAESRAALVRQTLAGAVRSAAEEAYSLADSAGEQVALADRLRDEVASAYAEGVRSVTVATADGSLLRGEVLARWQEFVGTGELLRTLESRVGRLRDRVGGWLRGTPPPADRVTVAVESGLEALLVEHAEAAAERAAASWEANAPGRALLGTAGEDLSRASRDLRAQVERAVRDWQAGVLDLVRTEGASKRSTARFLAFGVNGLGAALMVVVFASTGGVTGAEVGIAGGSAVVGQKLLEAVFGDQAVRRLAEHARQDLAERVTALYDVEAARYGDLLDALGLDPAVPDRLRAAAGEVARHQGELT